MFLLVFVIAEGGMIKQESDPMHESAAASLPPNINYDSYNNTPTHSSTPQPPQPWQPPSSSMGDTLQNLQMNANDAVDASPSQRSPEEDEMMNMLSNKVILDQVNFSY